MKYDFSRLGDNISYLRRSTGMTQEMLAYRLGVSPQAVSKWERQLSCPDVSLLPVMADVFEVSIDELFVSLDPDSAANHIDALPWEDDGRGCASRSLRASASAYGRSTSARMGRRWCCSSGTRTASTPCPSARWGTRARSKRPLNSIPLLGTGARAVPPLPPTAE